jgi:putative methionine-R-sulfoxide reductase with GAF domain
LNTLGDNLDYNLAERQIRDIISRDDDLLLTHVVEYLYENFQNYSWVGIYLVKDNFLILGPWRGPNATEHTKIPIGKGICGSAAASGKTEVISDVNADKRYLSCFVTTKSEIVVPIKKDGKVLGEIDIDSDKRSAFTNKDKEFLEKIADMLRLHI